MNKCIYAILSSSVLLFGCDAYCSDEAICNKRQCEAGYDNGSCEEWESYCKFNPEDSECTDSASVESK